MRTRENDPKSNSMIIFQRLILKDMTTELLSLEKATKILKKILFMMRR